MRASTLCTLASALGTGLCSSVLLSGGTIIAFDPEKEALDVVRNGAVLVTDDRIAGIYTTPDIPPDHLPPGTETVDCAHKIITPGFIDTHRHGWQTALKTLASNTTLAEYVQRYVYEAMASAFAPDDLYISQLAGLLEALNAGVTTTLDHAHNTWSKELTEPGLHASVDSGARVYWAHSFSPFGPYSLKDQMANFRAWDKQSKEGDGLVTVSMAWDFWSVAPDATKQVVALAKEVSTPVLTTHWLGGVWPNTASPQLLRDHGILDTPTAVVFSHGASLNANDAALLRQSNQFLSITPESEMHYGHTHAHAHRVLDQAALGVDTHFTFSTDVLTQARLWLQRTRARLFDDTLLRRWQVPATNPMSANQAFLLATRQGALALRRDDLGVVRAGAKADLVVFDGRSPGMLGWNDPVAAVILHANVGDITDVMVDGRFVKRDRRLTYPGYRDDVVERFLATAERLQAAFLQKPAPGFGSTFLGTPCTFGYPAEVDAQRGPGTGYGELFL
ncbi:amidohydrolase [Xylariomycetidae sp. FL2044]|nr:amidohydrolase [Xylariomycetidae sp. FL2044]